MKHMPPLSPPPLPEILIVDNNGSISKSRVMLTGMKLTVQEQKCLVPFVIMIAEFSKILYIWREILPR
jgi:hypothetical protein